LSSSLDLDKVAALILKESIKALGADHASLFLIDDKLNHLVLVKASGFSGNEMDNIKLLGSWEVITDQLIKKRKPLIVNNVHSNRLFRKKELPFAHERIPVQSFIAVPLLKDRRVMGALIVSNRKRPGHLFTTKDEKLIAALSNNISIALMNAPL